LVGRRQRRRRELLLATQVQRRAAGDEHLQLRAARQQVGYQWRSREHLLEIVEQQQQLFAA
jgi:hypothetical protein